MKNVKTTVVGNKLTIEVDLSQDFGPSASGKTTIIASSEGNVTPDGAPKGVKVGINVYKAR